MDPAHVDAAHSRESGRPLDPEQVRRQVAELVSEITSGAVSAAQVLAGAPLLDLGLDSLGWLRLIDALEVAHGVEVDLGGADLRGATVDHVVTRVRAAA